MSAYADRFTVVLDACVLGGGLKRNLLLSLAEAGFFRPRWNTRILSETEKAIERISRGQADTHKQRQAIEEAFPEAMVQEYTHLEAGLMLPDPDDIHVLATAIAVGAAVIVTDNLKDFPDDFLSMHGIEALSCDDFIADSFELDPAEAAAAIRRMRERFQNPKIDAANLIQRAEAQGLLQTATIIGKYESLI